MSQLNLTPKLRRREYLGSIKRRLITTFTKLILVIAIKFTHDIGSKIDYK